MNVTTQVFVLFLVALVGALCRHNGYLTDAVIHSLTQLVISITAPCLILYNMQREFSRELLSSHVKTCVVEDIRRGDEDTVDELVDLLRKLMR